MMNWQRTEGKECELTESMVMHVGRLEMEDCRWQII